MAHKLKLHGIVGSWWDRNDSKSVTDEIDGLKSDEEIHVRINSPGGSVNHGVAIYNALREHEGKVVVHVDALAASAASLIAMAGDEIIMGLGSMMMIHNPWSLTAGDAEQHRKSADMLDKHAEAMAQIYADGGDVSQEEALEIMAAETWLTAQDAVDQGFATKVDGDEDADALADVAKFEDQLKKFNDVPAQFRARVAAAMREAPPAITPTVEPSAGADDMTIKKKKQGENNSAPSQSGTAVAQGAQPEPPEAIDLEAEKAAAKAAERERISEIQKACNAASLDDTFAQKLIDNDVPLDEARAKIINALYECEPEPQANVNTQVGREAITGGQTSRQKFVEGAEKSLLSRAGFEDHDPQNNYNGYTLAELAREALKVNGVDKPMHRDQMIEQAFVQASANHSTSDFANLISNVAYRSVSRGFEAQAETFEAWTSVGQVNNFLEHERVNLNEFPSLRKVEEGAEYKHATIGDSGQPVTIAKYGEKFSVTMETIINDDLGQITRVPEKFARAAKRTLGDLAYAVLTVNPTLSDGTALFHADHSNLDTTSLGIDALDEAETAMMLQTDDDGNEHASNITPAFLLVPPALKHTARQILGSEYEPGQVNALNTVAGLMQLIIDARLGGVGATNWFAAADPNAWDTVEMTYLQGRQAPTLMTKDGWNVDGTEFKIRMIAGANPLDYRGLYKSVGDDS